MKKHSRKQCEIDHVSSTCGEPPSPVDVPGIIYCYRPGIPGRI